MKKIIALLLAAIMVLGLAACASKTEPGAFLLLSAAALPDLRKRRSRKH